MEKEEKRSWWRRLFRIEHGLTFGQWFAERLWSNWDRIAVLTVSSGGLTYLAVTDWVWNLGPLAWGLAFFAGLILALIIMWLYEVVAEKRDRRHLFQQLAARPQAINVLEKNFRDQRITASDFFNSYMIPNKGITFHGCELIGPCDLFFTGDTVMHSPVHVNTQNVVLKQNTDGKISLLGGVVVFESCAFVSCTFVGCTFFITPEILKKMREHTRGPVEVITYEPPSETP